MAGLSRVQVQWGLIRVERVGHLESFLRPDGAGVCCSRVSCYCSVYSSLKFCLPGPRMFDLGWCAPACALNETVPKTSL